MSRFKFICVVLLLIGSVSSYAQPDTKADEKTIKDLRQFRTDYIQGMNGKKMDELQKYYDQSIRLMPEFQKTIMTAKNISTYYISFFYRFDVSKYNREETEIIDLGTRVIETGTFTETLILKETKQSEPITGKYIDVWSKENGKLLLISQSWNYNQGLPWEDKLKFNEVPSVNVAMEAHVPINNPVSFELAALNRLMERIVSEHDNTLWVQFYSDDGSFLYSRHRPAIGKKELTSFLEEHVKGLPIFEKLDIRNDRIDDLGNYVIEYASHIAIIRHGDFSGVFTGKDLAIWRREPNGSLKIFRHIGMYD